MPSLNPKLNIVYSEVQDIAKDVAHRYAKGDITLQAIGDDYGLTRERIRQMIFWYDPTIPLTVKKMRRRKKQEETLKRRVAVEERRKKLPSNFHGTRARYNKGCHCAECRAANYAEAKISRAKMAAKLKADPSIRPHGVINTYANWGCRCDLCVKANSEYCKVYTRTRQYPRRNSLRRTDG